MYYNCFQCLQDTVAYYRIKNRHVNLFQTELAYTTTLMTNSGGSWARRVVASTVESRQ